MKVTANIATQKSRLPVLPDMLASIYDQVDEIRVHINEYDEEVAHALTDWQLYRKQLFPFELKLKFSGGGPDMADNAKFHFLNAVTEPELYLPCDDDIIYPADYVERIKADIAKHPGHIITYHGRIILAKGLEYYHAHQCFKFFKNQELDYPVDIAGTGVCAFNTSLFKPSTIANDPRKRMSDLLFSLEAAKANIPII